MRWLPVLLLFCLAVVVPFSSAAQQCNPLAPGPGISPMRALYVQDQRDRGVRFADNGDDTPAKEPKDVSTEDQIKCDAQRQQNVRGMLSRGELKTADDFRDASFIFQHGHVPEDYLLAHILAMQGMALGGETSRWIAAASLDRYLQSLGQKQVFGTQYSDDRFAYYLQHKGDADVLTRMKTIPELMTQEPNNSTLVPAGLRRSFCVPSTEEQQAFVNARRQGKQADFPRVESCKR